MKFCPMCNSVMVRADLYDPEGTTPLYMVSDEEGQIWACMYCPTNKGEKGCVQPHTE